MLMWLGVGAWYGVWCVVVWLGVVNYPVYVASNSCQKSMDAPLYQLPTLFSQISNTLCRDALAAYACSNTYQK